MTKKTFFILLAASLLSSCGYQFQGGGSKLPKDIQTVAVPPVKNDTSLLGLELKFTEQLRERFERYGVVQVVEKPEGADAILEASIRNVDTKTRNTTGRTDVQLETDITMTVTAELRRKNGQVLWRDTNITVTDAFASTGDVVVTSSSSFAQSGISAATLGGLGANEVSRGQQLEALDGIIEEVAQKIYLEAVASDF